jgi:hypothetical protein
VGIVPVFNHSKFQIHEKEGLDNISIPLDLFPNSSAMVTVVGDDLKYKTNFEGWSADEYNQYINSWKKWGNDLWTFYESTAYFSDVNPFKLSLYEWSDAYLACHPNNTVYVTYEIPQIWIPSEDNWVASAKFWVPKTDPTYALYKYAIEQVHSPDLAVQVAVQAIRIQPLFTLLHEYLGDSVPTYDQYLEAKAHVLHRAYYRDDPTDGITPMQSLELSEEYLRSNTDSYKYYLDFTTIKQSDEPMQIGRPSLTAIGGEQPFLNYSDPVAYYVDYLEMCLLSRYQTGYESCQQYNPQIALRQLRDTVILTAAGVFGCFVGRCSTRWSWSKSLPKDYNWWE